MHRPVPRDGDRQSRLRVANARWPLGDELPERVRELNRRVADYYESGEQNREAIL